MRTVVGLFERYEDADRAISALNSRGFTAKETNVIARDRAVQDRLVTEREPDMVSAGSGAAGGAVVGGIAGLLTGVGALAIPGVGPVVAAGALASTLAGAGIGAVTGGLLGALLDWGLPEEEANFYAEGVKRGGILVAVRADEGRADEAKAILREAGAVDVNTRREQWQRQGWTGFDANTNPGDNYSTL